MNAFTWDFRGVHPMTARYETLLCQYRHDALDRLVGNMMPGEQERQHFYCRNRLSSEIQGKISHSIVQHADQLLAQLQSDGDVSHTILLASDQQRSVLQTLKTNHQPQPIAYLPYGYSLFTSWLLSILGFNGERRDPLTGNYLLGNGYRAFSPVLMRFNSPDHLSPFGEGGFNAYAYCENDPINYADPSGKVKLFLISRRIFVQSNVSNALSRVKKSLGSIEKTKAIKTVNKTTLPSPPNTQQTNVLATKKSPARTPDTYKNLSTLAHKKMDTNKTSTTQNRTGIAPIFNDAGPDRWDIQLRPRSVQPVVNRPVSPPIRNYAPPDSWDVLLPTAPRLQSIVQLIRMKV
jgi:RHS repeat-associated protein